jgi:hypothetical protein
LAAAPSAVIARKSLRKPLNSSSRVPQWFDHDRVPGFKADDLVPVREKRGVF